MNKKFLPLFIFAIAFFTLIDVALPQPANAGYLDPGSGSILVQSIIASLAFFGRIKAKIRNLFHFGKKKEA